MAGKTRAAKGAALHAGGGMNAGTVYATLKLYDDDFLKPLQRANQGLQQFQKKFGSLQQQMDKAAQTLGVVGAAGMAATGVFVKLAMDIEQTKIALGSLLGSAEAAASMLQQLRDFAIKTPFEFVGLQDSTRRLLAFGFAAKDIVPILTDIGDATSALGGNQELINRIILALGQMQAKAKVTGGEMRQLTEAGIPGWRYLAEAMGKSTAEVMKMSEKGLLPAAEGIKAIREGIRRDFGGMMAEQAKTAAGQLSNLIDQLKIVGAEIGDTVLPAFKGMVGQLAATGEWVGKLSPEMKALLGNTLAYGSAAALVAAGLLVMGNQILTVIGITKALIFAQQAAAAEAANNTAAVLAYGLSLQKLSLDMIKAGQAALYAAVALEEEALATGAATAADLGFLAAEQAKAAAMLRSAQAAGAEGMALAAGASAQRATFLGLTPVMWGVVAAVAALGTAWYLYNRRMNETLDTARAEVSSLDAQIKAIQAAKSEREAEARSLEKLAAEYDKLAKKSERTKSEQIELANTKDKLTRQMAKVRDELGLQAKAWDGTAKSIRDAVAALRDFTKEERDAAVLMAERQVADLRVQVLGARKRVARNQYPQGARGGAAQWLDLNVPLFPGAEKPALSRQDQALLDAARAEERDLYAQYRIAQITLDELREAIAAGTWTPPAGKDDIAIPTGLPGDGKKGKAPPVPLLEQVRQQVRDAREIAEMLGWDAEALASELAKIYESALTDLGKRVDTPQLHPAFGELSGGYRTWSQVSTELAKAREMAESAARVAAGSEEASRAALERRLALQQAEIALTVEDARWGEISLQTAMERLNAQRNNLDYLRDATRQRSEQRSIEEAMRGLLDGEASRITELYRADGLRGEQATEQLQSLRGQYDLLTQTVDVSRSLEDIDSRLQSIRLDALHTEDAKADALARQVKLTEDLAESYAKLHGSYLEELDVAKMRWENAEAALAALRASRAETNAILAGELKRNEALLAYLALLEKGKAQGLVPWDFRAVATPELGNLPAPNDKGAVTPRFLGPLDVIAQGLAQYISTHGPEIRDAFRRVKLADAIWNFSRDRNGIRNYLSQVAEEFGKRGLFTLLGADALQLNATTGLPQFIHSIFPKLNDMSPERAAKLKGQLQGGLGVAAGAYSLSQINTTDSLSGALQGAMGGMSIAQGVGMLLPALAGPVGMIAGAVGGALFGANAAREQAEEMAQKLREQQLEQLKRINNALQPVSDYFRRGLFGALPGSMSWGGVSVEYSWAVASRRGMQ